LRHFLDSFAPERPESPGKARLLAEGRPGSNQPLVRLSEAKSHVSLPQNRLKRGPNPKGRDGVQHAVLAILAAGVAGWIWGAIWYGVLGKSYQRALGLNPDDCKDKKMPLLPMVAAFVAALVMSAVLYQLLTNLGVLGVWPAMVAGFTVGVGFVLTTVLVNNMFQQKSFTLTVIDGGHWVLALVIEAAVISLLA
jgi:MFS family permease